MKEQLELAALAAGIEGLWDNEAECFVPVRGHLTWDPNNHPGDGAEMEAAVGISVSWGQKTVLCDCELPRNLLPASGLPDRYLSEVEYYTDHPTKQAARMAASLKVAEEVGRRMKQQREKHGTDIQTKAE